MKVVICDVLPVYNYSGIPSALLSERPGLKSNQVRLYIRGGEYFPLETIYVNIIFTIDYFSPQIGYDVTSLF